MKKLLLLLFVLGLMMACGQKQEPAEEAPATEEKMEEAAAPDTAMAADTMSVDAEEAAPEQ